MTAIMLKEAAETMRKDDGSRSGPVGFSRDPVAVNGTTAHPLRASPSADHGTALILLAALLAAAGIASTATCVTLLLRAVRPGRLAPPVLGFAGMTLLASSALCLILLAAR